MPVTRMFLAYKALPPMDFVGFYEDPCENSKTDNIKYIYI